MSSEQVTKFALKPAVVAGVTAVAAMVYLPGATVNVGSQQIPLALFAAGASFAASLLSEAVNSNVFEHIPQISVLSHPLHTALNVGVQTGTVCLIDNFFAPGLVGELGIGQIALVAAGAEVAGGYFANEWLRPWYEQMYGSNDA